MLMRPAILCRVALVGSFVLINSSTFAETRRECELQLRPQTKIATGAGIGTVGGGIVGAAACSGFLGLVFIDAGLSYGTCLATVTLGGTVLGTAASENSNANDRARCQGLAESE
jgi:hypothetical protein